MRWLWMVGGLLFGCGARASDPERSPADEANLSPGRACMAEASAPRERRGDAPERIEVSHLLVRHRELDDPRGATRTPEQACLRALEALEALRNGASWAETVTQFSDAKSDALGRVSAEELSPPFADAAFALEVDELSYVVETERGYHVILRTD